MFCKFTFRSMIIIYLVLFSRVPELDRCQIYEPGLVDPLLKQTYRKIPRLPRY
jgi:hypothetical protein